MEVCVLGPLEVAEGGRAFAIAARKQRALLAALALRPGRVVPVEVLVDQLWDRPPASAAHAIQVYVSALRGRLPAKDKLQSRAPGYVLDVSEDAVDAVRFERLVREGTTALAGGDPRRGAALLRAGLALWRGPALADAREGLLRLDAQRLDERRLEAHEACLLAELELGNHATVLDEAERLLAEHPLRERLVQAVMVARHRVGRQADALDAFRLYRRRLDDELGLVPSEELRTLERTILRDEASVPAIAPGRTEARGMRERLIGRERELREIAACLLDARGRVVTLTGPGGVGKTSLALAVAEELGRTYPGGAVVARLAEIDDPGLVLPTVAALIGAAPSDESPIEGIEQRLRAAPALVVLDNAEHLPAATTAIAELAARGRGSAILVTSRTPLRVEAERVVRIAPLGVPAPGASAADCLHAPAVVLLAERARDRGVSVGDDEAETLATIARRLDGVPLAIELAAARVGLLGIEGLLSRLDRALDLLATDRRDAPERQRTLRAVVEWSERLLDEQERALLASLAVFAGGASLAAIEEMAGYDEAELLDALASLVDHGLVRHEDAAQDRRFALPEPIRAFAADRLASSGREDEVRDRHVEWIAALAAAASLGLVGREQQRWLRVLDDELPNVRAAARWAERRRPELAARIVVDLYQYWFARGLLREARDLLDAPLAAEKLDVGVWAAAAVRAAWFDTELGRMDDAQQLADAAVEILRDHDGDSAWLQRALGALATVASARGDWEEAARHNGAILELARAGDDPRELAYALMNTASDAERAGDWTAVRGLLEEALAVLVRLEDERGVALAETNLAACLLMNGDEESAAALAARSLERVRRLDLRVVLPYVLAVNAHATLASDPVRAATLAADAAHLAAEQGLHEALCTAGLAKACALAATGDGDGALDALTAVDAFARSSSIALPPWFRDRAETVVREAVDAARWQAAGDAARSLTPSQAEAMLCG